MTPDIETVRRFWESKPCNLLYSPEEVGTREYFDQVEARKRYVEPHCPPFAEFDKWKGKRVMEIGCGLGTDAVSFARAGAIYSGIEYSKKSLDLTCKRFEVYGLNGRFFLWNAENLDELVPNETFDLIYSWGVIHHTPNPDKVIASALTHMHADSEFRLMLYAKESWKNIMIEAGLDRPEAQSGCPIFQTYTKQDILNLMVVYDVLDITQTHIFPYNIEQYKQYKYKGEPWFKEMPEAMFNALERKFGWHLLIRAKKSCNT